MINIRNKRLVFLGDSITKNGGYVYNLRSYFHYNNIPCEVYNRGIGGNRADMVEYLIDDEVIKIKPDYCFISYGVNDLGIWLYDSFKKADGKILSDREKRDAKYFDGILKTVRTLKQNGIVPVITSPFPVNENLIEKPDIPTLGDNKEKEDFIGPWFYKKQTFKNINDALYGYTLKLKDIAEKEDALFCDIFSMIKDALVENSGALGDDGIHYLEKGHALIAKCILDYLGFENVSSEFVKDAKNDEIGDLESEERSCASVRFNTFNKIHGYTPIEKTFDIIKERLKEQDLADWQIKTCNDFLKHFGKFDELRDLVILKTKEYMGE